MLGMNKISFITDLGELGIPYFDEDISEVEADLETLNKIMGD